MASALLMGIGIHLFLLPPPIWRINKRDSRPLPTPELIGSASVALTVLLLLPGLLKIIAPVLALTVYMVIRRKGLANLSKQADVLRSQIPLVIDLTNAVLAVGAPFHKAIDIAAQAVGEPISLELADFVRAANQDLHLAATLLASHEHLGVIGRSLARALESGASVRNVFERAAVEARRDMRLAAKKKARAVEIATAGPLAACFLPAFLLVAIVPTILSGF